MKLNLKCTICKKPADGKEHGHYEFNDQKYIWELRCKKHQSVDNPKYAKEEPYKGSDIYV